KVTPKPTKTSSRTGQSAGGARAGQAVSGSTIHETGGKIQSVIHCRRSRPSRSSGPKRFGAFRRQRGCAHFRVPRRIMPLPPLRTSPSLEPASVTDAQIDRLVYELYDLTEGEIKIVEGTI